MAKRKVILGISTYSSRLKAGLETENAFCSATVKTLNQEKVFFRIVEKLLLKEGLALGDVTHVCVVSGPGRFTGLRVSLTFASIMKELTDAKIYSADLFSVLVTKAALDRRFCAKLARGKHRKIAVVLRAFKKEYFLKFYCARSLKPEGNALWLDAGNLKKKLKSGALVISDLEDNEDVYRVIGVDPAVKGAFRVGPADVMRACMALKNTEIKPLYLKPAKYEAAARAFARGAERR